MNKKIRAVAYCRFSSDMQRDESIVAQKRIIRNFVNHNDNMEIVEYYSDEAKSGRSINKRDSFNRMIQDAKDGKFDVVIVHKLDRFSRSTVDSLDYQEKLKSYSVDLISVAEYIDDTPSGRLNLTLMSAINEYYVNNLATEVKKGMKETAYQCKHNGGIPPLGYNVNKKTKFLEINQEEAKTVKYIFCLANEGYGYMRIINKLNEMGYKTKNNKNFAKNSLRDLISNEKYKGVFTWGKAQTNSRGNRNTHSRTQNDVIRVEGGCPQIVETDVWEKANSLVKYNGKYSTNAKRDYLFSGFLYCSKCGGKLTGNSHVSGRNKSQYNGYRCCNKGNKGTTVCNLKEMKCEYIDNFVLDVFFKHFFSDEYMANIITQEINKKIKEMNKNDERMLTYKSKLKTLNTEKNNLTQAITEGGYIKVLVDRLHENEKEITKTLKDIQNHELVLSKEFEVEEVKAQLSNLIDYIKNPKTIEQVKLFFENFIERIEVSNEDIKVTFKVAFYFCDKMKNLIEIPYITEIRYSRKSLLKEYKNDLEPFKKFTDFFTKNTSVVSSGGCSPHPFHVSKQT